ncbi:MAG: hypothetical protein EOM91_04825 [Sphingobacteriia bacterium]|nr:hypothetical protein [Sphingobacteriia bacterium]NCC38704.1 hypothetical protein [Gammaproteobacteria bacterium]
MAPSELSFELADWEVLKIDERVTLPTLDTWLSEWESRGVPDGARLAFRWAVTPILLATMLMMRLTTLLRPGDIAAIELLSLSHQLTVLSEPEPAPPHRLQDNA